jgi:hypothetical protein
MASRYPAARTVSPDPAGLAPRAGGKTRVHAHPTAGQGGRPRCRTGRRTSGRQTVTDLAPPGLRVSDEAVAAIRRLGRPGRFRYRDDTTGAFVTDASELARIAALTIPPASSSVSTAVFDAYQNGTLATAWSSGPSRPAGGLQADERRLLHLLEPTRSSPARRRARPPM